MQRITAILSKELRTLLRTRKAFAALMAILFAVGGSVWVFWLATMESGETRQFSTMVEFSRVLFALLSGVQLGVLGLFAPILTAAAVTTEREEKTLDLLYCTRITRFHILVGKWFAAISFEVLLVLCMLPLVALCFQLGGVGLEEYVFMAVMTLMTVLTYSMIGLACSAWFRKTATSIFVALLIILFLGGGLGLGLLILGELRVFHYNGPRGPSPQGFLDSVFICVSPVIATIATWVTALDAPSSQSSSKTLFFSSIFLWHFVYQSIIFLLAACVGWRGLARAESQKTQVARKVVDDPQLLERRRKKFPYYLIDPLRRPQVIRDNQNPMYVLEVRTNALLRSTVLIRLSYALLLLSILAFYFMLFSNSIPSAAGLFSLFVLLPLVPVMTSTSLPREWQSGTMELLKASSLPATRIVWGKFRAAVRFLGALWIALLILPLVFWVAVIFYDGTEMLPLSYHFGVRGLRMIGDVLQVLPPVAAYLILYIAISIFCSSFFRRTAFALVTAYLAITAVFFMPQLTSISLEILSELSRIYFHTQREGFWTISPILAFLSQIFSPCFYFFPGDSVSYNMLNNGFKPVLEPSPILNALVFVPLILLTAWGFLRLTAWKLERARRKG